MDLREMKIIVTGAASGMGAHFATQLARAGALVAAGDVNDDGLRALAEANAGAAGAVHTRRLDVSNEASIASFVDWALDAMGGLNGLVNNAGILRDALLVKKDRTTGAVVVMDRAQWQAVIDVNLTGATFMVREVVSRMVTREQG